MSNSTFEATSEGVDQTTLGTHCLTVFYVPLLPKPHIAADLARPLAKLSANERTFIDQVLAQTLVRSAVLMQIRNHFRNKG